ncbi:hypothetical protein JKP88DRAFT_244614 [Tribonema minus]|uniref:Uncharacterized protein n=1 Tax=Tribonema minus TaxID=303371 RepID=A0A836CG42_9STRA|nr:hypothetical protein JKP88DRAFT_244614 [Tribonema minus]
MCTFPSSELNTINAFLAQGVLENNVYVPNPSKRVCETIQGAFSGAHVTQETIGELLATTQHQYDVVFLDYMCTAQGNTTTKPSRDVQQLFSRKLIKTPGIIATTFCKRNSQENQQERLMFETAMASGYRLMPLWSQVYQPAMVVTAYLVRETVGFTIEMEAFPQLTRKRNAQSYWLR